MQQKAIATVQLLAVATFALFLSCAHGHMSITFPPARFPNYDFLDNVRTGGPCGVPEDPNGPVTTFQAGSTINVTFHLAYPHRGGILVNLVNSNGTITYPLLGTEWVNINDSTRLHQVVTLPENFTCDRCVLQLLRQAGEWSAPGGGYVFWSCADVSIVDSQDAVCNNMTCSGRGTCNNITGVCDCDRLYSGDFCQNKDECMNDADCSNQGSCIDIKATTFPRRQCFCNPGWFGEGCSRPSSILDAEVDPSEYTIERELHDRLTLYARIVGDEIEVALIHNGTGYVALGWRPGQGIDGSCRAQAPGEFPVGSHPLWPDEQTFPTLNRTTNAIEVVNLPLFVLGGGAAEGGAEEGGAEEGGAEEGGPEEGAVQEGGAEEGAVQEGGAEEGGAEGGAEEGPAEEGGAEEGGATAPLHAMDCTDIVIGVARGNQYRVFDYYTRDRATPRMDSFYGGEDSLTGAIAKEMDGMTIVKWRKTLESNDPADHNITNQLISVIWSFGQVYPDYFHNPGSGIEAGTVENTRFYQPDEIKYHGSRNRGATSINFFDVQSTNNNSDICRGEFSTGCNALGQSCDYIATWEVNEFNVEFSVTARQGQSGRTEWVAIGFSDDKLMTNSDVVIGAADSSGFFVTDRFIDTYAPAPIDDSQDIINATAEFDNGFTTMAFIRPLAASDPRDLSLTQCRYFLFGWGGAATVGTRDITQHALTPIVSTKSICLPTPQQCGAPAVTVSVINGASRMATPTTVLSTLSVLFLIVLVTMLA